MTREERRAWRETIERAKSPKPIQIDYQLPPGSGTVIAPHRRNWLTKLLHAIRRLVWS